MTDRTTFLLQRKDVVLLYVIRNSTAYSSPQSGSRNRACSICYFAKQIYFFLSAWELRRMEAGCILDNDKLECYKQIAPKEKV